MVTKKDRYIVLVDKPGVLKVAHDIETGRYKVVVRDNKKVAVVNEIEEDSE